MTGRLLTAEQLADRWQVPKTHVYRLTREGKIPAVKLGKYYRYRLDQIEQFELGADTVATTNSGRSATVDHAPA